MNNDELFNAAADILENGGSIPSRVSGRLLAAMLLQTHAEAKCAKRLAKEAKQEVERLRDRLALRLGLVGGGATVASGIVAIVVLADKLGWL